MQVAFAPATLPVGVSVSKRKLSPCAAPAPGIENLEEAGLRYSSDTRRGYTRRRLRGHFVYFDTGGERVRDIAQIHRINKLAIPPAYTHVWICADARGHLQATGRDARGRKQYRYHPGWQTLRETTKYERMAAFGAALPRIRARVNRDLRLPGIQRNKVLATVVKMLDTTLIRIGGAEYARDNHSYGLTTLRKKHLQHLRPQAGQMRLKFSGKSGIEHDVTVRDRRIVRVVRRCMDIAGHDLFQYLDDAGQRHTVSSSDINAYLREISGMEFTAKDYRTWAGSVFALEALRKSQAADAVEARKNIVAVVKDAAKLLRNTPAVCRRCYVHPELFVAYEAGELAALPKPKRCSGLKTHEAMLIAFLEDKAQAAKALAR